MTTNKCHKCGRDHDAYAPCELTATYAAYLKRPLRLPTDDEARAMLESYRQLNLGFIGLLREALRDPTPHVVNYRAGRIYYHRPETFPILPRQRSPSDCTWIVPGTERGNSPPPSHVAQPGCPDPDWCSGNNCCYWDCQADPDLP